MTATATSSPHADDRSESFSLTERTACHLRSAKPSDMGYVVTTAINSVHDDLLRRMNLGRTLTDPRACREFKTLRSGWKLIGDAVINAVLLQSTVVVACKDDDPNVLFGWAAIIDGDPLYVYVGHHFKRRGIGTKLRTWQKDQQL